MNIITQNPFRILGLTCNTKEKELKKQIGIIKRYAEIGKTKSFDYDFDFLGDFSRNLDDIQQAASKIEQAQNKLQYSLFWFINNSSIDEIALNNLRDQNTDKAIEIWEKTLKHEVTDRNYSSYLNLSTLYIALSAIEGQLNINKLQKGISLKRELIYSNNLNSWIKQVTGHKLTIKQNEISKHFTERIIGAVTLYINTTDGISINILISLFSSFPKTVQDYLQFRFATEPLNRIEHEIEKSKEKRKIKPYDANLYGLNLYKSTITDLLNLTIVIGKNVQRHLIANKLAEEILQCSIDFYNTPGGNISHNDHSNIALEIAGYALRIEPDGQTKDRIEENVFNIRKWQDEALKNERENKVLSEINYILTELTKLELIPSTISKIDKIIDNIKPKLSSIKRKLGADDSIYLINCDKVVLKVINCLLSTSKNAPKLTKEFLEEKKLPESVFEINLEILFGDILITQYRLYDIPMTFKAKNEYKHCINEVKRIANSFGLSSLLLGEMKSSDLVNEINKTKAQVNQLESALIKKKEMAAQKLSSLEKWKFLRTKREKTIKYKQQERLNSDLVKLNERAIKDKKLELEMLERQHFLIRINMT